MMIINIIEQLLVRFLINSNILFLYNINRYRVTHAKSGKGVFSNVVKAMCIESGQEVAIKLLRSEEIYLRSGERERSILEVLNANDKGNKKHIV